MDVWTIVALLASSIQVAASAECKCDTDQKICTPPDGDIDCKNCGVYYKLEQGDSFQCVKRCPDGYYGSQSMSLCVPCSKITEHCSGCSNYDNTPRCDYCDYPYTLQDNVCGRGGSGDNTIVIVIIVFFSVLAVGVGLIIARYCYKRWHRAPLPDTESRYATAEDPEKPEGKQPHGKGFLRRFPLFGRTLSWELSTETPSEEYYSVPPQEEYESQQLPDQYECMDFANQQWDDYKCYENVPQLVKWESEPQSDQYEDVYECTSFAMPKRVSTKPKHPDPRQSFYQYPLPRYSVVVPQRATVIQKVYPTAQFRHYEPMPALHGDGDADGRFLWKFTIGPTGGVLQVMNITMCVPENAVDKPQDIIIGVSQNAADHPALDGKHSLASPVIHCLPHGTRFRRPVALSFGYNAYYTENEMCHLTVLCSETDVGQPTTWTEHEASSCAFGFGDERRCLVVLNRFCLVTVVCKDTPDQMQSKDISAMVFAKLGSDSKLLNLRVICVDNELVTMDLLRLNCVNSGYGNQLGNEPFFLYYNGKEIDVSLDELKACWQIDGKSKMTLSFMKVWRNSRPSCVFDVTPSGDLAPYFKCVVRVAQQDGNEEDQVADVKVTYEVKKERSKSSRRRTGVVGLPDQEATDHAYTVNVLRGCVDKMMKPRPDSRDNTHSFSDFKKPTTKEFVIPHKLKMELAILLNPIDKLHGRDWRHLASIMGLDDMIPYLDPIGGQTELLLNALDCFNVNLESITAVMREFEREDAAVTIEKYSQTR